MQSKFITILIKLKFNLLVSLQEDIIYYLYFPYRQQLVCLKGHSLKLNPSLTINQKTLVKKSPIFISFTVRMKSYLKN